MRSPENVLKSLSEKAKNKEYRYERLYRNLYNPEFYLLAYQNIATSQGSMTAGADGFTLDGMSMERIEKLIQKLRDHSYQPNPARRVYIAKKNSSKKRPLGIPSTDDKLLQEVVRMILEAIYEPTFSDNSHGFRPKRSCHTALKEIVTLFTGAKWIIEGDIKACFDSFDHHITIQLLRKRIKDEAFISLMWKFLRAGYMEQWTYHETYSGSPQGSGVSPILANIYLNELDEFMARMKKSFDKGDTRSRKVHKDHDKVRWAYRKAQKNLEIERTEANLAAFKEARKVMLSTPHLDEMPSEGRFHAEYDSERSYSKEELAQMFASVEWQADTMGASLLMPRRIIENALAKYNQSNPIRVYGDNTITSKDKAVIRRMAAYIGVSYTALVIRLRDMGLFEYHNILEYISNELNLGGVSQ